MSVITKKINEYLEKKSLNCYKLSKLVDYKNSSFDEMVKGKRPFPEQVLKKLLPILEISQEEFESWIVADKYPKEVLKLAIENKKNFPYKRKSMLTVKIDLILQEKGLSRAAVAKQINYSQSGLNRMISGKINMSKSVVERVSQVLEIPRNEIESWILADKYNLQILERAYSCTVL